MPPKKNGHMLLGFLQCLITAIRGLCPPNPLGFSAFDLRRQARQTQEPRFEAGLARRVPGRLGARVASLQGSILRGDIETLWRAIAMSITRLNPVSVCLDVR